METQQKLNAPPKSDDANKLYGSADNTPHLIHITTKKKTCVEYLSTLRIEPALFLFLTGYMMLMSCLPKLIMDKGCLYYFNYSREICKNMSYYEDEKMQLEILANNYGLYIKLLSFISAFTMIFIVPWSDKYGRKPPLFLACLGSVLSDIGFVICVILFDSNIAYLVLAKLPSEIFGGFICILAIIFSHSSEVTSEETRTQKYTTVEISLGLSFALGGLFGGMLQRYSGYLSAFLTATALHCCCLIWIALCVQETRGLDINATWCEKVKDFINFDNFIKGWKASMRRRENRGRSLILLFFLSICVEVLTYECFITIGFTYAHDLYNWDPMTYNSVNTIFSVSQMVMLMLCIPILLKFYKLSDYSLGIIGTFSFIGKFLLLSFAHAGVYIFYLGNGVGILGGLCTLSIRSCISKIADKDEIGRLFSFLAICESIFPIIGTLLVTKVFNATIRTYPNISYLMVVVFLLVPLGTFMMAYLLARRRQRTELKSPLVIN